MMTTVYSKNNLLMLVIKYHYITKNKLGLESMGSSLGIDLELFGRGVEWSGPAIRPGLDNRH